jgi:hypothetical protein
MARDKAAAWVSVLRMASVKTPLAQNGVRKYVILIHLNLA